MMENIIDLERKRKANAYHAQKTLELKAWKAKLPPERLFLMKEESRLESAWQRTHCPKKKDRIRAEYNAVFEKLIGYESFKTSTRPDRKYERAESECPIGGRVRAKPVAGAQKGTRSCITNGCKNVMRYGGLGLCGTCYSRHRKRSLKNA